MKKKIIKAKMTSHHDTYPFSPHPGFYSSVAPRPTALSLRVKSVRLAIMYIELATKVKIQSVVC